MNSLLAVRILSILPNSQKILTFIAGMSTNKKGRDHSVSPPLILDYGHYSITSCLFVKGKNRRKREKIGRLKKQTLSAIPDKGVYCGVSSRTLQGALFSLRFRRSGYHFGDVIVFLNQTAMEDTFSGMDTAVRRDIRGPETVRVLFQVVPR